MSISVEESANEIEQTFKMKLVFSKRISYYTFVLNKVSHDAK